jgi:hypothetical protein
LTLSLEVVERTSESASKSKQTSGDLPNQILNSSMAIVHKILLALLRRFVNGNFNILILSFFYFGKGLLQMQHTTRHLAAKNMIFAFHDVISWLKPVFLLIIAVTASRVTNTEPSIDMCCAVEYIRG